MKKDEKQKKKTTTPRTPKVATPKAASKRAPKKQKSPPHLVDEPDDDVTPENIDITIAGDPVADEITGDDHEIFSGEIEAIIANQDAAKAAQNVEAAAGGEKSGKNIKAMKETLVESEVHSDSSETESDIEVTKMAPTSYVSGKFRMKGPSRKKKGSDKEDATYEPSASEKEKLKKTKGLKKRKAQPTSDVSKKQKARKITTSIPEQIPEVETVKNVEVEIPVKREFRMVTPPASLTPESIQVQEDVHVTTPEQPAKIVEEPGSTIKKIPTPRKEGSSSGFPKVPSNLDAGPTGLEDFRDFFNDAKVK
ncbi:hypothetical protein HanXRQr2_Chr16g0739761 [Helianthus annuus]|uniref:Uncharacterized protein n=1 Tax=Helianthus annuus TaxID=4232 RepID=A0A9K3DPP6_HELAN|nr:uncharacterized protein LOC110916565 [Helianthus annuus]KAF5759316.1 hypothetical protein HanXRQr2_Chr16g0739761 [Helianthus annuus]KAJ0437544.1 hypothetical protein HanHA300_Chr16g0603341 [Helianthus annuus]KAJ0459863.1 hypothetical protein HanHA89_Chr16g0653871 [Helianthus annuus]